MKISFNRSQLKHCFADIGLRSPLWFSKSSRTRTKSWNFVGAPHDLNLTLSSVNKLLKSNKVQWTIFLSASPSSLALKAQLEQNQNQKLIFAQWCACIGKSALAHQPQFSHLYFNNLYCWRQKEQKKTFFSNPELCIYEYSFVTINIYVNIARAHTHRTLYKYLLSIAKVLPPPSNTCAAADFCVPYVLVMCAYLVTAVPRNHQGNASGIVLIY